MHLLINLSLALLLAVHLSATLAEDRKTIKVYEGFVTGQEYLDMSPSEQDSYVMGIVDGLLVAPLIFDSGFRAQPIKTCISTKIWDGRHLSLNVLKYIQKRPSEWNKAAHQMTLSVLQELCPSI